MNDFQRAIKRGIETGLDNHFSKKESKKVWLTVEEAKEVWECLRYEAYCAPKELVDNIKKRIEQAEAQK